MNHAATRLLISQCPNDIIYVQDFDLAYELTIPVATRSPFAAFIVDGDFATVLTHEGRIKQTTIATAFGESK